MSVLRENNRALDFGDLAQRISREADRIRLTRNGRHTNRVRDERNAGASAVIERLELITAMLGQAAIRNEPRREVPQRLTGIFRILRPFTLSVVRPFNYLFKPQRELNALLIDTLYELIAFQSTVVIDMVRLRSATVETTSVEPEAGTRLEGGSD